MPQFGLTIGGRSDSARATLDFFAIQVDLHDLHLTV